MTTGDAASIPPEALEPAELAEFRGALDRVETPRFSPTVLIVTAGLFIWFATYFNGLVGALSLVGVVLVHELGHLAAMRLFGYKDTSIYFLPLVGGLATGRPRHPSAWKEGMVLLAGPVPGLLAGFVLAVGWGLSGGTMPQWVELALGMMIAINAFNLLPVMPLDGGRLMSIALFSGMPGLEVVFSIVTGGLLAVAALLAGDYLIAAFIGMVVYGAITGRHHVFVAHELRARLGVLPADAEALSDEQLVELRRAALSVLPDAAHHVADPRTRTTAMANHARRIHRRGAVPIAGVGARVGLVLAFALAWTPILLFVVLALLGSAAGA